MNRRDFFEEAALLSAAGLLTSSGIGVETASASNQEKQTALTPEQLQNLQQKMGYSDAEMRRFLENPRNRKLLKRLGDFSRIAVVFEIVKAKGCLVGHQPGETFVFPGAASLDTAGSAPRLCPYLMPPMTRLTAIIQERIWEGLDPKPLFYTGQCDDVGLDCNGLGRAIIEARIESRTEARAKSHTAG